MRLRLAAGGFYIGHHPGAAGTWLEGEERDVPADTAVYLLAEQGHRFAACVEAPSAAMRVDVAEPPADRAIAAPAPRGRKRGA